MSYHEYDYCETDSVSLLLLCPDLLHTFGCVLRVCLCAHVVCACVHVCVCARVRVCTCVIHMSNLCFYRFNFQDPTSLSLEGHPPPVTFKAASSGACHCLVMWWETQLAPGVVLSTSPHHPPQVSTATPPYTLSILSVFSQYSI